MIGRWSIGVGSLLFPFAFAHAADIPIKAPAKTPAMSASPVPSWTGTYVGVAVGARWNDGRFITSNVAPSFVEIFGSSPTASIGDVAVRFGGYAGSNYQFAARWVAGIEGYGGYADNKKSLNPIPGGPITQQGLGVLTNLPSAVVRETWDAGVRARVGYLVTNSTLVYATGGGAWQEASIQSSCPAFGGALDFCTINEGAPKASKVMSGWTVGGGVEFRLTANWFARLDYQYADYGTFSHVFFTVNPGNFDDRYTATVKVRTHTANVGIAYKF